MRGPAVMAAMSEEDLQAREAVSEESRERVARILALERIMHTRWGPAHQHFRSQLVAR